MSLIWIQGIGVLVTLIAAVLAAWNAHSANKSQTDVQLRTVSLDELEKALVFTGSQLTDLRAHVVRQDDAMRVQQDEIRELQHQYQECERSKLKLERDIRQLRNGGTHG